MHLIGDIGITYKEKRFLEKKYPQHINQMFVKMSNWDIYATNVGLWKHLIQTAGSLHKSKFYKIKERIW